MAETEIIFLGVGGATPGPGEDTACFLINGTVLFDCGWNAAGRMTDYDYDPTAVEFLFLTHCHHDHYLGLPGLLFLRAMHLAWKIPKAHPLKLLHIVGPQDDLPIVLEATRAFLQTKRFPACWPPLQIHPLSPGETFEAEHFRIETIPALHPVTGFCGRFTDKQSGVAIAFSGDTGPNPALVNLARHADLLIHEATRPPEFPDEQTQGGHSRITDAVRVARDAAVRRLRLVHMSRRNAKWLQTAREIYPAAQFAAQGETLKLSAGRPAESSL